MGRRVQCCTVQGNSGNFWPKKGKFREPKTTPPHPKKRNSDDQVLDKGRYNGSKLTRRKRLFWLSSKAWSRVEGWFHNSYNIFLFCPRVFDRISVVFILNTKFQVLNWKKLIFFFLPQSTWAFLLPFANIWCWCHLQKHHQLLHSPAANVSFKPEFLQFNKEYNGAQFGWGVTRILFKGTPEYFRTWPESHTTNVYFHKKSQT